VASIIERIDLGGASNLMRVLICLAVPSGPISLTKTQFDALFEGIDWQKEKVVPLQTHKLDFL
jgi:hypothetical protein